VEKLAHAIKQTADVVAADAHDAGGGVGDPKPFGVDTWFDGQFHREWRLVLGHDLRIAADLDLTREDAPDVRNHGCGLQWGSQPERLHPFGLPLGGARQNQDGDQKLSHGLSVLADRLGLTTTDYTDFTD
jgi:hypothetical protein